MAQEHKLVTYQVNDDNLPQYKYEAVCSCGFSTKMPNEQTVKSQYIAHLDGRGLVGLKYIFPVLGRFPVEKEVLVQEQADKVETTPSGSGIKKIGGWSPFKNR